MQCLADSFRAFSRQESGNRQASLAAEGKCSQTRAARKDQETGWPGTHPGRQEGDKSRPSETETLKITHNSENFNGVNYGLQTHSFLLSEANLHSKPDRPDLVQATDFPN